MGVIYSARDFEDVLKPIECTLGSEMAEIFYQHNTYCKFVCANVTSTTAMVAETFHCERGHWHSEMLGIQTVQDIKNIMWAKCAANQNLTLVKHQEGVYSRIHKIVLHSKALKFLSFKNESLSKTNQQSRCFLSEKKIW